MASHASPHGPGPGASPHGPGPGASPHGPGPGASPAPTAPSRIAAPGLEGLAPVLIANRGEIAVRIARTLGDLGLRSVAVASDVDADAPHVQAADVAVRIGPAEAHASYLSIEAVLAAARRADVSAVHPGYGFLSENAAFARACESAGITWIGPPPEAIELLGDKARAKALAADLGVPVVAGLDGRNGQTISADGLRSFCSQHGLPVIIKALAGGGGRGMRVVRATGELDGALEAARREALAAFGDDRVLVERYLSAPRHIEVQILADAHGHVLHLGERECSLQRRHQKVVEEAPSPALGERDRVRMGAAAVSLARACGYVGAGTVEFLVPGDSDGADAAQDGERDFYFLEMNTRLQVEHPVTELVYGIDLVEAQLRIAAGERVEIAQERIRPSGHSVEARVYAEDPAAGFLPATGKLLAWRTPRALGVRVDSGVAEGQQLNTHYDPLLAKVIAHGPDRPTALRRLQRALGELVTLGVPTSVAFTRALLADPDVRAGALDTGLLERVLEQSSLSPPPDLLGAAALALFLADVERAAQHSSVPFAWTVGGPAATWRRRVEHSGTVAELWVRGTPAAAELGWGEQAWRGTVSRLAGGDVRAELDGCTRRYALAGEGDALWIGRDGHQLRVLSAAAAADQALALVGSLEAPMPGTVLLVKVADGDQVRQGQVLLVLESMKMELEISAPRDGLVEGLSLSPGDRVGVGQALLAVSEPASDALSLTEAASPISRVDR